MAAVRQMFSPIWTRTWKRLTTEQATKNAPIEISDEQLLSNICELQARINIKLSPFLVRELGRVSLDVEVETGTGKTYVYIKTMLHGRLNTPKPAGSLMI